MSKLLSINKEYAEWLKSLSQRFRQSQIKAAVKVNSELYSNAMKISPQVEGNFLKASGQVMLYVQNILENNWSRTVLELRDKKLKEEEE